MSASRPIPTGEAAHVALDVIDWAASSVEAEALDQVRVAEVRRRLSGPMLDSSGWRIVYDLALVVWSKGYASRLI